MHTPSPWRPLSAVDLVERKRAYQGPDAFDFSGSWYRARGEGILGWNDDGGDLPDNDIRRMTLVQQEAFVQGVREVASGLAPCPFDEVSGITAREGALVWLDARVHDGGDALDRGAWTHDLVMAVILACAPLDVSLPLLFADNDGEAVLRLAQVDDQDMRDLRFLEGVHRADRELSAAVSGAG